MSDKAYWVTAFLAAGAIIYAGAVFFQPLLTAFHVLVCVLLILVVLLQSGRAADLAGAFGGAGSQTAFGPRGAATFLSKATTYLAVVFMVTSLALAIYSRPGAESAVQQTAPPPAEETQPAEESPAPAEDSEPLPPEGLEQPPQQ